MYAILALAVFSIAVFFINRLTGLIWDPRSLADLIALLPRSNSLKDYFGTEVFKTKVQFEEKLAVRSDRLGYWRTNNPSQGIFYCLGEEGAPTRRYSLQHGKVKEKGPVQQQDQPTEQMRDGADLRERQGQAAKQQGKTGNIDQRQGCR